MAADCGLDVATGYLPTRVARDCVATSDVGSYFYNALPDGDWDILAFKNTNPAGKLRAAVWPIWKPKRITMAGANLQTEIVLIKFPTLAITAELQGGDDQLAVDEDGIVKVTATASSGGGVEGQVTGVNFTGGKPLKQTGPTGGGTVTNDRLEEIARNPSKKRETDPRSGNGSRVG